MSIDTKIVQATAPVGLTPATLAPPGRRRGWFPEWARLLLTNPKSAAGIGLLAVIVCTAIFAPLITQHNANDPFELPHQGP